MLFQPEIWKTHRRRNEYDECPHCGSPLRWIYDGLQWYPCDKKPVLFILHPEGTKHIVYKKELYQNALLYTPGDKRFYGVSPLYGSIQHYFTCPVLIQHRRDYARR